MAMLSSCNSSNHIHFAIQREGGFVDPTRFLQSRMFDMPTWVQSCDDFKLEYKVFVCNNIYSLIFLGILFYFFIDTNYLYFLN